MGHLTGRWVRAGIAAALLAAAGCASGGSVGGGGGGGCTAGHESCPCAEGDLCLAGLSCLSGVCVDTTPGGGDAGPGGGGRLDAGPRPGGGGATDAGPGGGIRDARPADAFFEEEPESCYCNEDGTMDCTYPEPADVECPPDRPREGCRCETPGETRPCWPGRSINRSRGICRDGTITCNAFDEFSGAWGACTGYQLPLEGATRGAEACGCFSAGRWAIDNLSPCFVEYSGSQVYAVSTIVSGGSAACPPIGTSPPPPRPGSPWSDNRLTVDCQGRFTLCYTLRAGDVETAGPADCVVSRVCVEDVWYREAGVEQVLPPLPSWVGTDSACARRFRDSGGYGEMSVLGTSQECEPIDDGAAGELVFNRVQYCPIDCPPGGGGRPECMGCMMGGSGAF